MDNSHVMFCCIIPRFKRNVIVYSLLKSHYNVQFYTRCTIFFEFLVNSI